MCFTPAVLVWAVTKSYRFTEPEPVRLFARQLGAIENVESSMHDVNKSTVGQCFEVALKPGQFFDDPVLEFKDCFS